MMKGASIYLSKIHHKKKSMNKLKNWNMLEAYFFDICLKVFGFGVNGFHLIQWQES